MKRICFVGQSYFPKDPRIQRFIDLLIENNWEVDIICLKSEILKTYECNKNLHIYNIDIHKKRAGVLRYLYEYFIFFIKAFFKLTNLYFKRRYNVIHVYTLPDFLVFSALIPKLFGAKILLDLHEIAPEFYQVKFNKSSRHWIIKLLCWIEKRSMRFAHFSITVTHAIKDIFVKRAITENKIDVIMNVPPLDTSSPSRKFDYTRRFNIVYHGTLISLYSIDVVIKAVALVKDKIPHIKYYIFGDGHEQEELENLVKELKLEQHVLFHGWISYEDILIKLNEMDIGALAISRNIFIDLSFSNKLAEYTALGIPVIITELPTAKYYYKNNSLLYFDGTVNNLADQLIFAYNNPEEMENQIIKAYDSFLKISWTIMSQKYLKIINNLIKKEANKI